MSIKALSIASVSALLLVACATPQENPHYQHSTQYQGAYNTAPTQAPTSAPVQAAPVRYVTPASSQSYSYNTNQAYQECLNRDNNRQLLGTAIGGTVGALAGNKVIGGTKGTLLGAAAGGAAGYGLGGATVDCDKILAQSQSYTQQNYTPATSTHSQGQYQTQAPTYVIPAGSSQTTSAPLISAENPEFTAPSSTEGAYAESFGTPGYHAIQSATEQEVPGMPGYTYADTQSYEAASAPTAPVTTSAAPVIIDAANQSNWHTVGEDDTVYSLSRSRCVGIEDVRQMNGLGADYGIKIGQSLQLPDSRC